MNCQGKDPSINSVLSTDKITYVAIAVTNTPTSSFLQLTSIFPFKLSIWQSITHLHDTVNNYYFMFVFQSPVGYKVIKKTVVQSQIV